MITPSIVDLIIIIFENLSVSVIPRFPVPGIWFWIQTQKVGGRFRWPHLPALGRG